MSFAFPRPAPRRRPSLTPMIDVVFLLLVFFMLAARFGQDGAIPLSAAGEGDGYSGPPRLVSLGVGGITLNGRPLPASEVAAALGRLVDAPTDAILVETGPDVPLQDLADLLGLLSGAGFTNLVLLP
ncbi:biopolymer transporter ExbD [Rhodobacterales bacterium HKCCE2091]|nr:biopolymer transporter ExbD [Rhodobacterales bacterium HKCCE2091]